MKNKIAKSSMSPMPFISASPMPTMSPVPKVSISPAVKMTPMPKVTKLPILDKIKTKTSPLPFIKQTPVPKLAKPHQYNNSIAYNDLKKNPKIRFQRYPIIKT